MGKRKKSSRGPQGPKKREGLATSFKCVFCNHETAVSVKINRKVGVGDLACKSCGQNFQCSINYLSQPVDVYSEWIDACDSVAKDTVSTSGFAPPSAYRPTTQLPTSSREGIASGEKYADEDDDGFVEDDEADAEAEYADE